MNTSLTLQQQCLCLLFVLLSHCQMCQTFTCCFCSVQFGLWIFSDWIRLEKRKSLSVQEEPTHLVQAKTMEHFARVSGLSQTTSRSYPRTPSSWTKCSCQGHCLSLILHAQFGLSVLNFQSCHWEAWLQRARWNWALLFSSGLWERHRSLLMILNPGALGSRLWVCLWTCFCMTILLYLKSRNFSTLSSVLRRQCIIY